MSRPFHPIASRFAPALAAIAAGALAFASAAEAKPAPAAVRAQALAAEARAAGDRGEWTRAADLYRAALALDPGSADARAGLAAIDTIAAGRAPAAPEADAGAVRTQADLVAARTALARARAAAAVGERSAALDGLDAARARLQPHAGVAEVDALLVEVVAEQRRIRGDDQRARAATDVEERERIRAAAEGERAREEAQRRGERAERTARIRDLARRDLVALALERARALVRDYPGDAEAEGLYQELLARAHERRRTDTAERDEELRARVLERLHEALIPAGSDGRPMFPADWAERHREAGRVGTDITAFEPWQERLLNSLASRISVDFQDMAVDEALAFVARSGGFNVVIDPAVLAAARPVTLRAADLRVDQCLNWLARLTGNRWTVAKGAVFFGGEQQEEAVLAVYDLASLVQAPYDQPGPAVAFTAGGAGGADGGGFNIFQQPGEAAAAPSPEDVVDVIRRAVSPQTWELPGNSIEIRGNTLYVTAPRSVHHLLAEFVRSQAHARAVLVRVQARWLTIEDTWLEEIGVDWGGAASLLAGGPSGYRHRSATAQDVGSVINVLPANATTVQTADPGGLTLSMLQLARHQVSAVFTAVERKGQGRILASQDLLTTNGVRSHAFFGQQYAYIADYEIVGGNLDPTIEVLTYGSVLDIKPFVSADRKYVTMEFRPAITDVTSFVEVIEAVIVPPGGDDVVVPGVPPPVPVVGAFPIELPNVRLREVGTTIQVPDGGSLLVGGFGRHIEQQASAKVPFLGHIPYLGRLFGKRGQYSERAKLYLLASVDIINYQEAEETL